MADSTPLNYTHTATQAQLFTNTYNYTSGGRAESESQTISQITIKIDRALLLYAKGSKIQTRKLIIPKLHSDTEEKEARFKKIYWVRPRVRGG